MDPESGEQPLVSVDGKYTLAVNGEVNHKELKTQLREPYAKTGQTAKSSSRCSSSLGFRS